MKRLLAGLPILFFTAANLLAQNQSPSPEESASPVFDEKAAKGAMAALLAGGIVTCLMALVGVGIWLWIAIFIMKDSARRQSPNRTLVVVLGWLVPIVGLIVHLATRPKTIPGAPNP